ncbi:MAG: flavodoxin family protein [Candidatus Lokiarchaeota archaeon]|nr:flavodoxin family protein [Candidatus Lokiarchaeota archaeon]MBD3198848.1 flavodoxin family protein [Candidatus Lokiarchaeota archaeon]
MSENQNLLLGICGSPRQQGTEYAVQYALKYAADKFEFETEYWSVGKKELKFCIHCDYCIREKKGCIHKDDIQELYPKLETARFLLFGTPVFQGTLSGQIKTVMDRCRAMVAKNPEVFKNKIGMALAVGGDRSGGQEIAIRSILDFFQQNHIITVSGGAFGSNLGAALWSDDRGKEGVSNDAEGLKAIRKVIKRANEFKI